MAYKNLEKVTANFISEIEGAGGPPLYKLSPTEARKVLEKVQSAHPYEPLPVLIEEDKILEGDKEVSVRFIRPESSNGELPIIMYFHGGGWILGNKVTHDRLARELAVQANACVVFVNFTPAPEAQYPTQIEEAYAATKFIYENARSMNLDATRLVVAGDSVGGNMATVVAMLAKQNNGPKIIYQILFYPVTDANFETASYKEFAKGPWLTKAAMEWFWNAYCPKASDRKQPTASPLHASAAQLHNLPPALFITDENDVLRDEGEAYARKLMEAGVDVTAVRYFGTMHDFLLLNALADTPAARNALSLAIATLQRAFAEAKPQLKIKPARKRKAA